MKPEETGAHYDRIALRWQNEHANSDYGIPALERAIGFTQYRTTALDVGCGSSGRFIELLIQRGFTPEGLDVSAGMLALARIRHPHVIFHHADISTWEFPRKFDLISAWDSTFHLPLEKQRPALEGMCRGLEPHGVLLFTCGGGAAREEISGSFDGETFGYSTLGVDEYLLLLAEFGCSCTHLEYDQHPDNHVYIIAQRKA